MLFKVIGFKNSEKFVAFAKANATGGGRTDIILCDNSVYIDTFNPKTEPLDFGIDAIPMHNYRIPKTETFFKRKEHICAIGKDREVNTTILSDDVCSKLLNILPLSVFTAKANVFRITLETCNGRIRANTKPSLGYYLNNSPIYQIKLSVGGDKSLSDIFCSDGIFDIAYENICESDKYSAEETESFLSAVSQYIKPFIRENTLRCNQDIPYELVDKIYRNKKGIKIGDYRGKDTFLDFQKNVAIVGESGSGKTTFLSGFALNALEKEKAVIIISPIKQDFRSLFSKYKGEKKIYSAVSDNHYPLYINLVKPPMGSNFKEYKSCFINIIKAITSQGGGDSVFPIFFRSAASAIENRPGSVDKFNISLFGRVLLDAFRRNGYKGEFGANGNSALRARIKEVMDEPFFFTDNGNLDFDRMFEKGSLTLIELDNLCSEELHSLADVLIRMITYAARKRKNKGNGITLIIDESHVLLGGASDRFTHETNTRELIQDGVYENRFAGLQTVLCDQRSSMIGEETILNGFPQRIFLRGENNEISERLFGNGVDLSKLKPGEAVYSISGHSPIFVQLVGKGIRTDPEAISEANKKIYSQNTPCDKPFNWCVKCAHRKDPDLSFCEKTISSGKFRFYNSNKLPDGTETCSWKVQEFLHNTLVLGGEEK